MIDYASNIGLSNEKGLKSVFCNGVILSFAAALDSLPRPGEYQVTRQPSFPEGTVSVVLSSPIITTGYWPLAMSGAFLEGFEGTVKLDSMSRKQAWARFRFRARRQHRGE